ncbi:MAG: lactonase family protein [Firmicutes bacterium]|nr:lactonase family protein [Bacillota bacterium]
MYFYTSGYGDYIYYCNYDKELTVLEKYLSPGATYLRQFGKFLYATNEIPGKATAFKINDDASLTLLNEVYVGGDSPCHLSFNEDGSLVYIANYMSGTTSILNILQDGSLGEISKIIDHTTFASPSKVYPKRQDTAHAHYAEYIDGNVWVCDLGLDMVLVINGEGQAIAQYKAPAGSGPRHLVFNNKCQMVYLICEMGNIVVPLSIDYLSLRGRHLPTLPDNLPTHSDSAAIRISPGGNFLFASNRGKSSDSISVFSLNKDGSIYGLDSTVPTYGKCPRDFIFAPTHDKVLVACQESNKVNLLDWEEKTGTLSYAGLFVEVDQPTCVLFPNL